VETDAVIAKFIVKVIMDT